MRYLMIIPLLFSTACGLAQGDANTTQAEPELVGAENGPENGPDALDAAEGLTDETDASKTGAAPATGLSGPARTVAGLGDPSRPGLWLETPLVQAEAQGRVRLVSGGAAIAVTLLPAPGPATAGSRLSLTAMRQLGAPLSALVELEVSPAG